MYLFVFICSAGDAEASEVTSCNAGSQWLTSFFLLWLIHLGRFVAIWNWDIYCCYRCFSYCWWFCYCCFVIVVVIFTVFVVFAAAAVFVLVLLAVVVVVTVLLLVIDYNVSAATATVVVALRHNHTIMPEVIFCSYEMIAKKLFHF